MRVVTKVCLFAVLWIVILKVAAGTSNPTIPREGPPSFPVTSPAPTPPGGTPMVFAEPVIRYVYRCDYVTNVNAVITETRFVAITNVVHMKTYPKTLKIKVKSSTSLTNEWIFTGHEFLVQLGTNAVEFYTAEVSIE